MGYYKNMDIEIQNMFNANTEWFFIRIEERIDTLCNQLKFLTDEKDRQIYLGLIEKMYEFYALMQII